MTADTFQIHGEPGQVAALFAALAKAQGEFGPIERSRTVQVKSDRGSYSFAYAPLDTVLSAVTPALSRNGLALLQPPHRPSHGDWLLTTLLVHADGARLQLEASIPPNDSWQKFGSALTYCRRYQVGSLLGVAPEDDDDGNHADGNQVTAQQDKRQNPGAPPKREAKPAPAETKPRQTETKAPPAETKPAPVPEKPADGGEIAKQALSAAEAPAALQKAAEEEIAKVQAAVGTRTVEPLPTPMDQDQAAKIKAELRPLGFSNKDQVVAEAIRVIGKPHTEFSQQDAERFLAHLQANADEIRGRLAAT